MRKLLAAAVAACIPLLATAQADPLAAIDRLQGEARTRALVEAAQKEGEVMVYHSTQTSDLRPVFEAFTAKYGIRVKDWRSSSENVVQRVISQTRAGKLEVDLIENNSPEMEALRRENMLRRMESPFHADMRPGTLGAHKAYATSTIDVFVQAYNTRASRGKSSRRRTRTSPIPAGRTGSASRPRTRTGSARSATRWGARRRWRCSRTSSRRTACRSARGTRCSPTW